jgi:hypothetical protein
VCDFCEKQPPTWYYPVDGNPTVPIGRVPVAFDLGFLSHEAWVAYGVCHGFIDADDYAGLAEHMGYETATPRPLNLTMFRERRIGPAQPL